MKKILIIDDDIVFQKTMIAKLVPLGYEIVTASDGEEGLNKAGLEKPNIILLDIRMPKLDGISFLKKMRANKDVPQIPVIITSNLTTMDNIGEGVALGVKGYIIKSNETLDTIIKEIEAVLNPEKKIESEITPA